MSNLPDRVEARRLALGLSQKAVAARLGISQPHFSKVVGRLVALTPAMEQAMRDWLSTAPAGSAVADPKALKIRTLTRSIQRQLRELNALIDHDGTAPGRRPPRPTRRS